MGLITYLHTTVGFDNVLKGRSDLHQLRKVPGEGDVLPWRLQYGREGGSSGYLGQSSMTTPPGMEWSQGRHGMELRPITIDTTRGRGESLQLGKKAQGELAWREAFIEEGV